MCLFCKDFKYKICFTVRNQSYNILRGYYRLEIKCTVSPQMEANKVMVAAGEVKCTVVLKRISLYNQFPFSN